MRFTISLPFTLCGVLLALAGPAAGQAPGRINACALVPKAEVRKHLPWHDVLDNIPVEEEAIGAAGSSCSYPSVFIQVLPFSQGMFDSVRTKTGVETISGVGDAAYLHNNANQYAELIVRTGSRLLTLQADIDSTIDAARPGIVSLARVLVARLR